jgi:hypothetical protein
MGNAGTKHEDQTHNVGDTDKNENATDHDGVVDDNDDNDLKNTIHGTNVNDQSKPVPFLKFIGLAYPERYMLFSGLADCLTKTVKSSGISGLYNGVGVSVAGIIPYRGAYFGLFDTLSGYNPYQKDTNGFLRAGSKFVCAQFSAISAGYASYPFDTIRRRLQMQSEKPKEEWVYAGTVDCFQKIVANEGVAALFKGAGANALRTVGAAMVLVMYSEITAYFGIESGGGE